MSRSPYFKSCAVCGQGVGVESATNDPDVQCSRCGNLLWFRVRSWQRTATVELLPSVVTALVEVSFLVKRLIRSEAAPRIILDLTTVRLASARLLRCLVAFQQQLQDANGTLVLCGVHPVIREALDAAKIADRFEFGDPPNYVHPNAHNWATGLQRFVDLISEPFRRHCPVPARDQTEKAA